MNYNKLIKRCINHLQTNFPIRTKNYNKCKRDLTYILEALENDIANNTNMFTTRIANRFWYNGMRQIYSYEAEVSVYNFLLTQLKGLPEEQYSIAKKSIETLIRIVENGVEVTNQNDEIIQDAVSAEHCQRNWDYDYQIPQEDIDLLVKIATTMPTKQNREYYQLIVSTDQEFNDKVFECTVNDNDSESTLKRNSQSRAPILFLYLNNNSVESGRNDDSTRANVLLSTGISSGAVALAAAQMKYKTGFCKCISNQKMKPIFKEYNIDLKKDEGVEFVLGIGMPKFDNWGKNLERPMQVASLDKCIKVIKIN